MSYSLNSLKGDYIGGYIGDYYRGYYSSCNDTHFAAQPCLNLYTPQSCVGLRAPRIYDEGLGMKECGPRVLIRKATFKRARLKMRPICLNKERQDPFQRYGTPPF